MQVKLDPVTKRILLSLLASPKTPAEVSRIHGIPIILVWQKIRHLEDLGIVRRALAFVDTRGAFRLYFEAVLPVDTSEDEVIVEA